MVKQIVAAFRTQIYIQRIFLLSPLKFNSNGDLSTGWRQIIYTYCVLLMFGALSIFLTLVTDTNSEYFTANGFVWLIFGLSDFFLAKIAFVVIVIIAERRKNQQISFFHSLAQLDSILQKEFNIIINYVIYRRVNLIAAGFIIIFLGGSAFDIGKRLIRIGIYTDYEAPAMVITIFIELCAFAFIVMIYINGVMLIGDKFTIIKNVMLSKQVHDEEKLKKLIYVYIELFKVITIWNDYIGWIMMIRLTHDFTASTTVSYVLFSTIIDNSGAGSNMFNILALLSQNVIRIVLVTVFAEHARTKVSAEVLWCDTRFKSSWILIIIS